MYVEHFKLKKRPFVNGSDTETFLSDPSSENAVTRVRHIMLARNGAALLTGGPGVGKSTIVYQAMKDVTDRVFLIDVDLRQTDPSLLYQMVLLSLGAELGDGNVADSLHRLRRTIRKINDSGRQVTVVIDINGFTLERANHILRLSHVANQTGGQLNIILMGPHSLHRLLDTPGLIHIRQRIGFRYRVRPFTVAETNEYIQNQIDNTKGKSDNVLADGIGMTVYQYVGGVPRLINTLMDASLSQASAQKLDTLNADTINEVAKDLGWRPLSRGESVQAPTEKPQVKAAPARRKNDPAPAAAQEKKAKSKKGGKTKDKEVEIETVTDEEIFEQPLDVMPENEKAVHEGTDVRNAVSEARTSENKESGELTQQLLTAAENLEADLQGNGTGAPAEAAKPPAGVPEMNAEDTSATGMLRLEDLDARFAETVFGDDTGMFNAIEQMEKMRAAEESEES